MERMEVDLSESEYLKFYKSDNQTKMDKFIFVNSTYLFYGKNGTGKTTFANLMQSQLGINYDVRVFKGFDEILKEKTDLDLVILGEKNIIAFLYFMEKLNEIDNANQKSTMLVLDGPMTSNNDTMQYIIYDKLYKLNNSIKDSKRQYTVKYLFILTHNIHFFLMLDAGLFYHQTYNCFVVVKNGMNAEIRKIEDKEMQTAYDSLWYELWICYNNNENSEHILLNAIRRIIETFCNFNNISMDRFYSTTLDLKKYFDVNSHKADPTSDIYTDLSPLSKIKIMKLFEELFKTNGFEEHYKVHCEKFKKE